MRTLIIDDEADCRNATRLTIKKYCPDVQIIGEATGVTEGLMAIKNLNPDLVLLDVQMQDGTGFDLVEKLGHFGFKLIFITSFDQFALKAFRCSAIDYVLKPIEPEIMIRAIAKARETQTSKQIQQQVEILLNREKTPQRLALPVQDGLIMIEVEQVAYCGSNSNYTTFFMANGSKHVVSRTMKDFEDLFPETLFMRIHKSYLVNVKFITRYIKGDGGEVVMHNKAQLPVSRMRKDALLDRLKK
jgi:two-component system, LytTR family, response regulator